MLGEKVLEHVFSAVLRWATLFCLYLHQQNLSFELPVVRKSSTDGSSDLPHLLPQRPPRAFNLSGKKVESEIGVGGDVGKCHP